MYTRTNVIVHAHTHAHTHTKCIHTHTVHGLAEVDGFFVQQSGLAVVAGDAGEGGAEGGEGGARHDYRACRGKELLQVGVVRAAYCVWRVVHGVVCMRGCVRGCVRLSVCVDSECLGSV